MISHRYASSMSDGLFPCPLVALPERDVCACRMPQGRSRIYDLRCSDLTTKAWTTSSTGSRVCPQWISVGSCSPKRNSYLLGFIKLVLTCQCLRFLTTGFAGEDLAQYLRRCLAHRHASNMTCSTELRERKPYIGVCALPIATTSALACTLIPRTAQPVVSRTS
jgi:hypothetical protein